MKLTYKHTFFACCLSYIVQATVNNLPPLLYIIFRENLGLSLGQISVLITLNFLLQLGMDVTSTLFVDKIGYRASVVLASVTASIGLMGFGVFPLFLSHAFTALLIATVFACLGGGLIEVVVSPMVEALPKAESASQMHLLHSFYSWGQMAVILGSTLFFSVFGKAAWIWLPVLWSFLPLSTAVLFTMVPVCSLPAATEIKGKAPLFHLPLFRNLCVLMICAGAAELAMAQWASYFAETALGVSKTVGDLLGPCLFAVFMGLGRVFFARVPKESFEKWMLASFGLGIVSYLLAALSPVPYLSLFGCALCGLSVAILWPGLYSYGAEKIPNASTSMFAWFAFFGDIGCTVGPDLVGAVSSAVEDGKLLFLSYVFSGEPIEIGMKGGILLASVFPLIGVVATLTLRKNKQ